LNTSFKYGRICSQNLAIATTVAGPTLRADSSLIGLLKPALWALEQSQEGQTRALQAYTSPSSLLKENIEREYKENSL
jgi:hypothetical protein